MQQKLSSHERRAAILDAAVNLFSQKGFRGTTTRELAAAVGVTEPVLYQHFETKGDLYAAIIEAKAEAGRADWDREIDERLSGSDDRALFQWVGERILEWHREDPTLLRLLLYSALEGHDLAARFFDKHVQSFMDVLECYIRRRQREGAFRHVDPATAVRSFTGMVGHYGIHSVLFRRSLPAPDSQVLETMVDVFLRGIENPCES